MTDKNIAEIHPDEPILEYNQITDNIYIGTNMCCQTHFEDELKEKGITADVSLEEEQMDSPKGVEFYTWIPVKDKTAPTQDQLMLGVHTLQGLVKQGKKVYVHCKFGHGRSPTLVAAYLIAEGKTAKEAIEFVHKRRYGMHLEKVQKEALEEYEKLKATEGA